MSSLCVLDSVLIRLFNRFYYSITQLHHSLSFVSSSHSKATILQNNQLDFLKEIVSLIPDIQTSGDEHLEHPANYADYLSLASNNSNHHKLGTNPIQRQFSHPSTSHNPLRRSTNLGISTQSDGTASSLTGGPAGQSINPVAALRVAPVPLHPTGSSDQLTGLVPVAACSSAPFLIANSRPLNAYSRSNSAPSSTNDLLVSAEVLRAELKNKRKLKRQDESMYEDLEEEDEEYELSSDENETSEQTGEQSGGHSTGGHSISGHPTSSTDNGTKPGVHSNLISSELPCSSMASLDNKLENCKVSKRRPELEDDDYDA